MCVETEILRDSRSNENVENVWSKNFSIPMWLMSSSNERSGDFVAWFKFIFPSARGLKTRYLTWTAWVFACFDLSGFSVTNVECLHPMKNLISLWIYAFSKNHSCGNGNGRKWELVYGNSAEMGQYDNTSISVMKIRMTYWEWEEIGILKTISAHLICRNPPCLLIRYVFVI